MRVTARSEEEIQTMGLLSPGTYDFEVAKAEDQISNQGNEMIKLTLKVWDMGGAVHLIYDYLLDAMAFKLRHFAEATGLLEKYNAGHLEANDCERRMGKVEIIIQKGKDKNDGTGNWYPDKNAVKDYFVKKGGFGATTLSSNTDQFLNDDVPF